MDLGLGNVWSQRCGVESHQHTGRSKNYRSGGVAWERTEEEQARHRTEPCECSNLRGR